MDIHHRRYVKKRKLTTFKIDKITAIASGQGGVILEEEN